MKFMISRKSLEHMLNMISETINNISSDYTLKEIIIVAGKDDLYVMGKYLDITITIQKSCNVQEIGTILIDKKYLTTVINCLDKYITVESIDNNLIKISDDNTEINMLTRDITTYPSTNIEDEFNRKVMNLY